MRELGRYVLESRGAGAADVAGLFDGAVGVVDAWLAGKGYRGEPDFSMPGGRDACVERSDVSSPVGDLTAWTLREHIPHGFFETTVQVARSDDTVHVACTLAAGHGSNRIAPLHVDAHCPGAISRLLDYGHWSLGPTPVARRPLTARGDQGGMELVEVLEQPDRSLPVVVVSSHHGLVIRADLPDRLARDLAGLALVTVVDDDASWRLTTTVGKALSCYHGAIRLYWAGFRKGDAPLRHPLWTAQRLLSRSQSIEHAADTLCTTLRRRLMSVSIVALAEPPVLASIREADTAHRAAASREHLRELADYQSLAESYADENERLRVERDHLADTCTALRRQLYRFQTESAWTDASDELGPDEDVPAASVAEAVERARTRFASLLVFGHDVERGVSQLAPQAGPLEKLFSYLSTLAELVLERRKGPIGRSPVQWLSARNVEASNESERVRGSKTEMARRSWHDGSGARQFDWHLKPKESTHPDQCVRIYFDWDEASQQIVIGWVGRHP